MIPALLHSACSYQKCLTHCHSLHWFSSNSGFFSSFKTKVVNYERKVLSSDMLKEIFHKLHKSIMKHETQVQCFLCPSVSPFTYTRVTTSCAILGLYLVFWSSLLLLSGPDETFFPSPVALPPFSFHCVKVHSHRTKSEGETKREIGD